MSTDKLSAMTLAIMEAGAEFREHSKFNADVTELVLVSALGPAIRAAILAYLQALAEDEATVEAVLAEMLRWDHGPPQARAVLATLLQRAEDRA